MNAMTTNARIYKTGASMVARPTEAAQPVRMHTITLHLLAYLIWAMQALLCGMLRVLLSQVRS